MRILEEMSSDDEFNPVYERRTSEHEIRGTRYAVSEWGAPENPSIVFLHGWGDCAATFQFVADKLAKDWRVIAPDWRGFGDSAWNSTSYWFPDYVADLDELLAIYSPDEPARLVGHSMGANVGGLYAGSFPERVRAFVNIEGFGLVDVDPSEAPGRYRRWIEMSRNGTAFAEYDSFDSLAMRVRKRAPRISDAHAKFVAEAWAREEKGVVRLRSDPRHKLPNPVLYRRAESEACWRSVTAPVLLVAGEDSEFAAASHDQLSAGVGELSFPEASVKHLAGAGHMMHLEAPEALATAISDFFAQYL